MPLAPLAIGAVSFREQLAEIVDGLTASPSLPNP
jgi:hypothetical protein